MTSEIVCAILCGMTVFTFVMMIIYYDRRDKDIRKDFKTIVNMIEESCNLMLQFKSIIEIANERNKLISDENLGYAILMDSYCTEAAVEQRKGDFVTDWYVVVLTNKNVPFRPIFKRFNYTSGNKDEEDYARICAHELADAINEANKFTNN